MSAANGGSFGAGFAAGAVGSIAGGIGNKVFGGSFVGTTLTGGFAGGLGSLAAGGNFWDGFRNGAISAGLNHALHSAQMASKQNDKGWQDYFEQVAQQAELGVANAEVGLGAAQLGAIGYRQTLSIHQKVGSYRSFAHTYSRLGSAARGVGRTGFGLSIITTGFDFYAMQSGQISVGRFAYRTGSTALSVGLGYYASIAVGASAGLLTGGTISIFAIGAESFYSNIFIPGVQYLHQQFSHYYQAEIRQGYQNMRHGLSKQ